MKLTLNRIALKATYTIGKLYVNGEYFCDTLEDTVRTIKPDGSGKIMHETAISAGTYEVILNLSPKFRRKLPRLLNVPHFTGILIHSGNTPEHTSGCILVGENRVKGKVISSKPYEQRLVALMQQAVDRGEKVSIEIA